MYYFQNETKTKLIKFDGLIATIVTFGDGFPSVKKYDTIFDKKIPFGTLEPALPRDFEAMHNAANLRIETHLVGVKMKRVRKSRNTKVFA